MAGFFGVKVLFQQLVERSVFFQQRSDTQNNILDLALILLSHREKLIT
jgi:hypothetical protein